MDACNCRFLGMPYGGIYKKNKMLTPVSDVWPVCLIISWYFNESQDWISVIYGQVDWIYHYIGGTPVVYNYY